MTSTKKVFRDMDTRNIIDQGFNVASMNSEEQIIIINGWTSQELK